MHPGFGLKDKAQDGRQEPVQRTGIIAEIGPMLAERGLESAPLFASAGLPPPPLSRDQMIPYSAALRLLDLAAEAAHCPEFGLLLGQRFHLSHQGVIGELMRTAPTLGRALLDFTAWQPGYSSGAVVYLHRLGDDYALGYGAMGNGSPILYELVLSIGVRMLEELTGSTALPDEIHLPHREPPARSVHSRLLKAPVRFNQQRACIVLSRAALEARLPGADHQRHQALLREIRARIHPAGTDIAARTRQALRLLVPQGPPRMEAVAAELAMHPRTLRRHLAKEQTSFEALCDAIRFAMARELLDLTDLPVNEIAGAMAYASPGIFGDAFRRWTGLSPTAFRCREGLAFRATSD
jgi:AraC-like DNA-binding protein